MVLRVLYIFISLNLFNLQSYFILQMTSVLYCYDFSSLLPHDDHAVTSWLYSSLTMLSPHNLLAYATCFVAQQLRQ